MAGHAALSLDWRVLVDPRSCSLNVALGADGILGRADAKLIWLKSAVGIMAIAASDQPFVHAVMEGLGKSGFDVRMAAITELGLRHLEQVVIRLGLVNAMATVAVYACFAVGRPLKIRVGSRVAAEALLVDHPGRRLTELEDLRCIPARIDVGLARPMAVLAGDALVAMHEGHSRMRIFGEFLDFVFVACRAGFGAGVPGRNGWRGLRPSHRLRLVLASGSDPLDFPETWKQHHQRYTQKHTSHRHPQQKAQPKAS